MPAKKDGMTPAQKNEAINAALEAFHQASDGEVRTVVASAAGVLAMRVEQALNGVDWREAKTDGE